MISKDVWLLIMKNLNTYELSKIVNRIKKYEELYSDLTIYRTFRNALKQTMKNRYPKLMFDDDRGCDKLLFQIKTSSKCLCGKSSIKWYSYSNMMYRKLMNLLQKNKYKVRPYENYNVLRGICIKCVQNIFCKKLKSFPRDLANPNINLSEIYSNFKYQIVSVKNRLFLLQGHRDFKKLKYVDLREIRKFDNYKKSLKVYEFLRK